MEPNIPVWCVLASVGAVALLAVLGAPLVILTTHRAYARGLNPQERDPE